jgi:hypothetical protein
MLRLLMAPTICALSRIIRSAFWIAPEVKKGSYPLQHRPRLVRNNAIVTRANSRRDAPLANEVQRRVVEPAPPIALRQRGIDALDGEVSEVDQAAIRGTRRFKGAMGLQMEEPLRAYAHCETLTNAARRRSIAAYGMIVLVGITVVSPLNTVETANPSSIARINVASFPSSKIVSHPLHT